MPIKPLEQVQLDKLIAIYHFFGSHAASEKFSLLKNFATHSIKQVSILTRYHDLLLFLIAYPDNKQIFKIANEEITRIAGYAQKIIQSKNYAKQHALSGTGISGSIHIAQYSYSVTQWLINKFPGSATFHSASGNESQGADILHSLFPRIEYFLTTQGKYSIEKRMKLMFKKNNDPLHQIIHLLEQSGNNEKLCEILFNQLQLFTEWKLDDPFFNRTAIKGMPHPIFFHTNLLKKSTGLNLQTGKNPVQILISATEKENLLDVARASLALYCRETEPITLASAQEVKYFKCSRGIGIALFGMKPERRLTIESYIGYMVFKNSVPVAYGGGWMFGDRCKIGLNIYPPFRGGESALIFTNVLRVYHHFFGQERFIIKPYQYGKGNTEGLKSAAFWFYYKLGFRPVDEKISNLADLESSENKRSSLHMLKKFTQSDMQLTTSLASPFNLDPEMISKKISFMINEKFNGSREDALKNCSAHIMQWVSEKNRNNFYRNYKSQIHQSGLMYSLIPQLETWKRKEKQLLLKLIILKAENEYKYIQAVKENKNLLKELYDAVV